MRQGSMIHRVTLAGSIGNSVLPVAATVGSSVAGVLIIELVLIGLIEAESGLPI
jgi:hypothetical protein